VLDNGNNNDEASYYFLVKNEISNPSNNNKYVLVQIRKGVVLLAIFHKNYLHSLPLFMSSCCNFSIYFKEAKKCFINAFMRVHLSKFMGIIYNAQK
jgi:hypothetical protein